MCNKRMPKSEEFWRRIPSKPELCSTAPEKSAVGVIRQQAPTVGSFHYDDSIYVVYTSINTFDNNIVVY